MNMIIKIFISKNISDDDKERSLLTNSKKLFLGSAKIIIILGIIILLYFTFKFINDSFGNLILSFSGLIQTTFIIFIYYKIRKYFNAKL